MLSHKLVAFWVQFRASRSITLEFVHQFVDPLSLQCRHPSIFGNDLSAIFYGSLELFIIVVKISSLFQNGSILFGYLSTFSDTILQFSILLYCLSLMPSIVLGCSMANILTVALWIETSVSHN